MPAVPPTVRELAQRHALTLLVADGAEATADVAPTGVSLDSRRVGPGELYAALPGAQVHGARFTGDAVASGAVAVLTDPAGATLADAALRTDGDPDGVPPLLVTPEPRARLGPLAADLYGNPSQDLALVGVTGTNGKTTVSFLVDALLRALGCTTGLIGTVRSRIGDEELASAFTTPEAPELQHLLARMRDAGCSVVSAEVSSHALAQHRVDGTRFAVAVFTNLSQDHLDFHGTMAVYFAAKLRLLTGGFARAAVVSVDDEWGRVAAEAAREAGLRVCTVASDGTPHEADVRVRVVASDPSGAQELSVQGPFGPDGGPVRLSVHLGMPGRFNAVNAALALAVVHLLAGLDEVPALAGVDGERLAGLLADVPGVPGRMERVVGPAGTPLVVVDYAHTPDAVAGAVAALRASTPGRLVVVLGAGGDRDQGKRQHMGEAASAADLVVVTDDNPRTEDPAAIRAAVLAGVGADRLEVADRREAVRAALRSCTGPQDTVLLAGKGHETGQSAGGRTEPFDDRQVAAELLRQWTPERSTTP